MARKLKIWNGRDWDCRGGHLFVCAYSVKDAVDLSNQAYRKIKGLESREDIRVTTAGEIKTYWSAGCWGLDMKGVVPERGMWWGKPNGMGMYEKPERIL